MQAYKVRFIETSFSTKFKYASKYGMLDGHQSAINLEAFLEEEYRNGYDLVSITPFVSNEAPSKYNYPIAITSGYNIVLRKI